MLINKKHRHDDAQLGLERVYGAGSVFVNFAEIAPMPRLSTVKPFKLLREASQGRWDSVVVPSLHRYSCHGVAVPTM